jgi:3-phosphoglycerate kinase
LKVHQVLEAPPNPPTGEQGTDKPPRTISASVGGGGDTAAMLGRIGLLDGFSHLSLAGGAFLEWLQNKELPGVAVLMSEDQVA